MRPPMSEDSPRAGDALFVRRLLLALLVLAVAGVLWYLRFVVVLAFGAILFAVILRAAAKPLRERFHLPDELALVLATTLILGAFAASVVLFGAQVATQAREIAAALPAALEEARNLAATVGVSLWFEQLIEDLVTGSTAAGDIGRFLVTLGDVITNLLILIVGGIFLAWRPDIYRVGLIKLVPAGGRGNAARALDDCGRALRLWLKGRLLAMVLVGAASGLGLWLFGIPSYLALALAAAVLEFVPFFGPILAAIPAILLALLQSPLDAARVAGLFLLIQQVEGNVLTPIIQQHAVKLPEALLLFALLAFGLLFGIIGVLLAEPLTVTLFVLVKLLYVREALHTSTPIPGEDGS